jgi:hypothetical protein
MNMVLKPLENMLVGLRMQKKTLKPSPNIRKNNPIRKKKINTLQEYPLASKILKQLGLREKKPKEQWRIWKVKDLN